MNKLVIFVSHKKLDKLIEKLSLMAIPIISKTDYMDKKLVTIASDLQPAELIDIIGDFSKHLSIFVESPITTFVTPPHQMRFLEARFGVDFAEHRYDVEVLPGICVECYANSAEQATEIVTKADFRVLSVTLHIYEPVRNKTITGVRISN